MSYRRPTQIATSIADAKKLASRLTSLLEEYGHSLTRCQAHEVVARLQGAHHYNELRKGLCKSGTVGRMHGAELIGPSLAEVLHRHCTGEITIDRMQQLAAVFGVRHDIYTEIIKIEPSGIEAAAKFARGERLTADERAWISNRHIHVLEFDESLVEGCDHLNGWGAFDLLQSRYIGDAMWDIGLNLVRFDFLEPCEPDQWSTLLPDRVHRNQARAARPFIPPDEFGAAGFEVFTVNIEARLMQRLAGDMKTLELRQCVWCPHGDPCTWMWAHSGIRARPLRAALLREQADGTYQLLQIYSYPDYPLDWMSMQITRSNSDGHVDDKCFDRSYHGAAGLRALWGDAYQQLSAGFSRAP
jgi:hypothetical protein